VEREILQIAVFMLKHFAKKAISVLIVNSLA